MITNCGTDEARAKQISSCRSVSHIMGVSREVVRSGWAGQESDDSHAHYAIVKHYSCSTYTY
jgi:hypothetical protein